MLIAFINILEAQLSRPFGGFACDAFIIIDKYITVTVPLSGSDNSYISATGEEYEAQGQVRAQ